jgi:hypothetical protein
VAARLLDVVKRAIGQVDDGAEPVRARIRRFSGDFDFHGWGPPAAWFAATMQLNILPRGGALVNSGASSPIRQSAGPGN